MRLLVLLAAVLAVVAALAPAAQAAFPGRNGAIGYAFSTNAGGDIGPAFQSSGLQAERVGTERERVVVRCERTDGVPSGGDCAGTEFRSPSYSRHGRRIVFDAGARIGIVPARGGPITLLPAVTADDGDPAFSPDGRRIVFTGTNDRGGTDVFVHRLGSMFARAIVTDARQPAWSSRNQIAYVREGNVYVADNRGQRRRLVTSGVAPDWSPGGGRLVFVRPAPRNTVAVDDGRVFTIGVRGRGLRRAVPRVDDATDPIWSPNGRWIAFENAFAGVWAHRLGSREPVIVQESQVGSEGGAANYFDPAWRPLPR
jgi:dipeptidyl aminopeptidase/acylaminoacyl peptidase